MRDFNPEIAVKLGEILRKAREEQNIDLNKAGESTLISPLYLAALEQGEWEKLPGRAYISGYLKIYSRLLKLNQEELLTLFRQAYEEKREKILLPTEKAIRRPKKRILSLLITLFTTLVLLFIVILVFYPVSFFPRLTPHGESPSQIVAENISPEVTEPIESSPSPEIPLFAYMVILQPEKLAWGEVRSNGQLIFSGILVPNKSYVFKSNTPIEISGHDGDRVRIFFNGSDLGYLNSEQGAFERTFGP